MGRDINATIIAALSAAEFELVVAVKIEFPSGDLQLWNGMGDQVLNGETYKGAGTLLSIGSVEETTESVARGAQIAVNGIPTEVLTIAMTENYHGSKCTIFIGVPGADPSVLFKGEVDMMDLDESPTFVDIQVKVENQLVVAMERPNTHRYNSESHKRTFPSDEGFSFVEGLRDKTIPWGRRS